MDKQRLDISKRRNRQKYYLTLKDGQSVDFLTKEGYIVGTLEIRNGELYLMKRHSLKGHDTTTGISFGGDEK